MSARSNLTKNLVPRFVFESTPLCSEVDPELFFPQESEVGGVIYSKYVNVSAAKQVCDECPLRIQCLEYAMSSNEIGIWGGTTEAQREGMKKSLRRAARRRMPSTLF
jgi:WhiB family redox-sensing transcriptional regulator